MTPEEITRQKAEAIMKRYAEAQPAIFEAINTINWIPIDPDNLPEGDVLCFLKDKDIRRGYIFRDSNEEIFLTHVSNVTHYAHVNLP